MRLVCISFLLCTFVLSSTLGATKKEPKLTAIDDTIDALYFLIKDRHFTEGFKLIDDIKAKSISDAPEADEFLLKRWYDQPQIYKYSELRFHIGMLKGMVDKCDGYFKNKETKNYQSCSRFGSLGRAVIRAKKFSIIPLSPLYEPFDKQYESWMKKNSPKEWDKIIKDEQQRKAERRRLVKKICDHNDKVRAMGRLMEFEKKAGVDFGYNNPEVLKDSKTILDKNNDEIFKDLQALEKISYDPFTSRECYLLKKEDEYYY